ncbi:carboxymuconolactone decarboxylase family protein [Vagococcus coleopterorum]|uniref:Carboxymuconolactone decarboxylase family protein n=2 Tax=Vagococcus coleopterorum TaxID=2714946 RepID=A0A6G8APT7_9ENTE|nr:carboxymuconolactone decarboxylase family protein [Vagococcus coleopterorum]
MKEFCGDVSHGFTTLHGAAVKDQALDKKQKEFIALGIAIAVRCEGCILAHVKTCLSLGVTMEEIASVVDVAVLMGGGPSTVYGGKALEIAKYLMEKE